ncbi:unnamed protein product, partial [Ectocarpus fasciculatus]
MPSNLFVVVFPRRVQAHTVFVDRKEKPKSKWSVGGLRSPPGLLGRDPKNGKGDDKGTGQDQGAGRDNASCGSLTSGGATGGSSSRDGSLARASASAVSARNELKNQKTVRVQLSRPTEDVMPEPGAAKKQRRGSHMQALAHHHHQQQQQQQQQHQHQHHPSTDVTASWHAPQTSNSLMLPRAESGLASSGGGGSLGSAGALGELLKRKEHSFYHIPSRSADLGNGGGSLADIFNDSERSSRASTTTGVVVSTSGYSGLFGVGGGSGANGGGGRGGGVEKHKEEDDDNASASSSQCFLGARESGGSGGNADAAAAAAAAAVPSEGSDEASADADADVEELVGADSAGNGGVFVKRSDAEKIERCGGGDDQPDRVPANRKAKADGGDKQQKAAVEGQEGRRRSAGAEETSNGVDYSREGRRRASSPTSSPAHGLDGISSRRSSIARLAEGGDLGEEGERKDAEEGGGGGGGVKGWDPEQTGDSEGGGKPTTPTAMSTPGSKRRLVTEVIGDGDDVDVSRPQDMDEGEKVDIEALVREILMEMRGDQLLIGEPTYHISASGKLMTCIFPCDVEDAHLVLTRLESIGVGSETGSVNVLPMEIGRSDITRRRRENDDLDEDKARRARHNRATGGRFGDLSGGRGSVDGS